eukprot:c38862_g1_i1.p1 GENE.c38862_g1_i1~~c38862_g1_i1.p1  ORF type:complete len:648 (+),score=122.20 c38862_g1_i1:132-1946(+)
MNETLTRLQSLEQAWEDVGEMSKKLTNKLQTIGANLQATADLAESTPAPAPVPAPAPARVPSQSSELRILDIVTEPDAGPPVGLVVPAWKLRQMAREQKMKSEFDKAKAEAEAQVAAEAANRPPPPPIISDEEFEQLLDSLSIPAPQRPAMRAMDNDKRHTLKNQVAMMKPAKPAPNPAAVALPPAPVVAPPTPVPQASPQRAEKESPQSKEDGKKAKRGLSLAGIFRRKSKPQPKSDPATRSSSDSSTRAMLSGDSHNLTDDNHVEHAIQETEESAFVDSESAQSDDLESPPEPAVPEWKVQSQHKMEDMDSQAMKARQEMLAGDEDDLLAPPALIVPDWKVLSCRKLQAMDADAKNAREEVELNELMAPPDAVVPEWKEKNQLKVQEMEAQAMSARKDMLEEDELMAPPQQVVPEWKVQNQLKVEEMEVQARSARKEMLEMEELMAPPEPVVPEWKVQNQLKVEEMDLQASSARKTMLEQSETVQPPKEPSDPETSSAGTPENDENASAHLNTKEASTKRETSLKSVTSQKGSTRMNRPISPKPPSASPKRIVSPSTKPVAAGAKRPGTTPAKPAGVESKRTSPTKTTGAPRAAGRAQQVRK